MTQTRVQMETEIERLDRLRLRYLGAYLSFSGVALVLFLVRFFFYAYGLNGSPAGMAVLIGLFVTVPASGLCVLGQGLLWARIRKDPRLKEALDDELLRAIEAQAWKAAYVGSAATVLFFAIASSMVHVCDGVTIALTTILVGAIAQRAAFYVKYRSA